MSLSQSQGNSIVTNATRQLKSVVEVASFRNSANEDVLVYLDDEGHILHVAYERERWDGEHERARTKRYRCAWCPKP